MRRRALLLAFIAVVFPRVLTAQAAGDSTAHIIRNLRSEIAQLRHELDSLNTLRQSDLISQSDMVDRLEETLEKRLSYLETKIDAVSRATAPVAFNPGMTAFINFAARGDSKRVYDLADPANEISNRPFLRTVEMELQGAVDPYASAVAVISVENQAGKDFAIDAEEAYGLLKRLPILEDAPLGMKVKIGKYRAPFGVSNKIHMHDLPWTTRPLAVAKYLGTEHGDFFESGYNPTGMDMDFYLPNPIPATTLEMNLDVVRSGELTLSQGHPGAQPAYVGHVNLSRDWSNRHLLTVGVSAYEEHGPAVTRLYGADVTYKWAPLEQRESHSFVAGGEVFAGRNVYTAAAGSPVSNSPVGWYAYVQYQTSYWLYLGVRYDAVQEPSNDRLTTRSLGEYASYYTTEFLRLRLGYEHRWSDIPAQNNLNTVLLEVNLVFGSHPTEPYWVNK